MGFSVKVMTNSYLLINMSILIYFFSISQILNAADKTKSRDVWELASKSDGVTIYTKSEDGPDLVSVRGEGTIYARPIDVLRTIQNPVEGSEWMPYVAEVKVLEDRGPLGVVSFTHIKAPWPVSDRYFINIGQQTELPDGGWRLSSKSLEDPRNDWLDHRKVRGLLYYSEIILRPVDGGSRTSISIEACSDPMGAIPRWLVSIAQREAPRDFITRLAIQLAKHNLLTSERSH